jgi:hypothetical protein
MVALYNNSHKNVNFIIQPCPESGGVEGKVSGVRVGKVSGVRNSMIKELRDWGIQGLINKTDRKHSIPKFLNSQFLN